jgi:hypothetical protein
MIEYSVDIIYGTIRQAIRSTKRRILGNSTVESAAAAGYLDV